MEKCAEKWSKMTDNTSLGEPSFLHDDVLILVFQYMDPKIVSSLCKWSRRLCVKNYSSPSTTMNNTVLSTLWVLADALVGGKIEEILIQCDSSQMYIVPVIKNKGKYNRFLLRAHNTFPIDPFDEYIKAHTTLKSERKKDYVLEMASWDDLAWCLKGIAKFVRNTKDHQVSIRGPTCPTELYWRSEDLLFRLGVKVFCISSKRDYAWEPEARHEALIGGHYKKFELDSRSPKTIVDQFMFWEGHRSYTFTKLLWTRDMDGIDVRDEICSEISLLVRKYWSIEAKPFELGLYYKIIHW